ncbi:dynein, cytoplasmic 1, intermediate chain 2a isoform X1 [Tachysurus ichikawai]
MLHLPMCLCIKKKGCLNCLTGSGPLSPTAKSAGTPSEAGSQDSGDGTTGPRTLHWDSDPSTLLLHSELGRGPAKLSIAKVIQVDFPPKEVVSYCKETQTPILSEQKEEVVKVCSLKVSGWYATEAEDTESTALHA